MSSAAAQIPQPEVHITLVLDRSGSMNSTREDVIGGFNAFVAEQKALPGACRLTMIQFDTQGIDHLYVASPIADVKPMRPIDFLPRGGTPLYDAIGQAIGETEARIKAKKDAEVQLFVIITDGDENQSNRYNRRQIFEMIETKQGEGWVFTFLGANQNAYATGMDLGIGKQNVSSFAATKGGTAAAYTSLSSNTAGLRSAVSMGITGQSVVDSGFYSFAGKGAEAFVHDGSGNGGPELKTSPGIDWAGAPPIPPGVAAGITVKVESPDGTTKDFSVVPGAKNPMEPTEDEPEA